MSSPPGYSSSPVRGESSTRDEPKRSVMDVLEKRFPPFNYEDIVRDFSEEELRDLEFQKQLNRMIVDLIIHFHTWASARYKHERNLTGRKLEGQINGILKTEAEQELSREYLFRSVMQIRQILAALSPL